MRRDIVRLIEAEKDVTNVVVLTHNIDFVYIQSVVIPALRRCGYPTLTIFADAQCANESYQYQHLVIDSLGHRFRVVPVAMQPGFRFHPKAILLSGLNKATLLVGSGNLTFGGWRENAEIWCRYDTDKDGTAPFAAFRNYLNSVLALTPLNESLATEVEECFEGANRPWAVNMEAPGRLLGSPGAGAALIEQMRGVVAGKPVNSLLVCSPYFDDAGDALTTLSSTFNTNVKVAVQSRHSGLKAEAAKTLGKRFDLATVSFHHRDIENKLREAFIHAKWYGFEHDNDITVFLGSANCSKAALTIPGAAGNAELMTAVTLTKEEFHTQFVEELVFVDVPPQLSSISAPEQSAEDSTPSIRIMAARLDQGVLQVAYTCPEGGKPSSLIVHALGGINTELDYIEVERGIIVVRGIQPDARQVSLKARTSDGEIISNLMWVDHEQALSTTARSRSVVDAVRKKVQSQDWTIGAWAEIANVFFRNLQYMPVRTRPTRTIGDGHQKPEDAERAYSAEDVFSDSYGLPSFAHHLPHELMGSDDRVTSLRQLLLRWFGMKDDSNQEKTPADSTTTGDTVEPDETTPSLTTPKQPVPPAPSERTITDSDRNRALQVLRVITDAMASPEYLAKRQPETLSVDIQFAAVLLREGLHESWITQDEYFLSTHKIWTALFFSCPADSRIGWLEHRYRNDDNPNDFIRRMASPKLTAALAAWAFEIPSSEDTPENVRFRLSQVLSVARLPWLWEQDSREDIAKELKELLTITTSGKSESYWESIESRWNQLIRQGYALRMVEEALSAKTPAEIKSAIQQADVRKGELLWQGTGGFCIAAQDFTRTTSTGNARILYLQQSREGAIKPEFAIPLKGLVQSNLISIPDKPKAVIVDMAQA